MNSSWHPRGGRCLHPFAVKNQRYQSEHFQSKKHLQVALLFKRWLVWPIALALRLQALLRFSQGWAERPQNDLAWCGVMYGPVSVEASQMERNSTASRKKMNGSKVWLQICGKTNVDGAFQIQILQSCSWKIGWTCPKSICSETSSRFDANLSHNSSQS